jgi:hypothetical protein
VIRRHRAVVDQDRASLRLPHLRNVASVREEAEVLWRCIRETTDPRQSRGVRAAERSTKFICNL